jgi:hypothetical protein
MSKENRSSPPDFWSTSPELPTEVFSAWQKSNGAISPVAIVATVDPDGAPRVAPYGSLRAVTPKRMRLCSLHGHNTYANLCRDGRVAVCLISPDSSVSVLGHARVIQEEMELESNFAVLEIEIEEVKNDMTYRIKVESGINIHAKEEFISWYVDLMNELDAVNEQHAKRDL